MPGATHVLGRVQQQQGGTHGLPPHGKTDAAMNARQPALTPVLQTRATRPVRRRRARGGPRAAAWGMTPWGKGREAKVAQRICRGGRGRRPSTPTAVERFCRAFQWFSRTRGGCHSVLSATRARLLCCVMSLCTPHAPTGHAPLEVIGPEARFMPLDRWVNDPFRALQERPQVQATALLADVLRPQAAPA